MFCRTQSARFTEGAPLSARAESLWHHSSKLVDLTVHSAAKTEIEVENQARDNRRLSVAVCRCRNCYNQKRKVGA